MSSFNKKNPSPGYKPGSHWVVCDRSGKVIRASDSRTEWDGTVVAKEEFEYRHPQDFVRPVKDDQTPSGPIRTEPEITYLATIYCITATSIPGVAIPGWAQPGNNSIYNASDYTVPTGTF